MHLHMLPTSLALLVLSSASLTLAAPVPQSQSCRAISFLSPRYQSILGLRENCKMALAGSDLPDAESPRHSKRHVPSSTSSTSTHIDPVKEFKACSKKIKHITANMYLDLARLKESLLAKGDSARPVTTWPERPLRASRTRAPGRTKGFNVRAWSDFGKRIVESLMTIDEQLVIAAVVAFVCACWVLAGIEIFIAQRGAGKQHNKQERQMRRVFRRGTKLRVTTYPFCLATIDEEGGPREEQTPLVWRSDEEKSAAVAILTPC